MCALCYFGDLLNPLDIKAIFYLFSASHAFFDNIWLMTLFPQASNNVITSLPEELANCSKLTKLDVEVLVRSLL